MLQACKQSLNWGNVCATWIYINTKAFYLIQNLILINLLIYTCPFIYLVPFLSQSYSGSLGITFLMVFPFIMCRCTHTHIHTSAPEFKARKGTVLCHLPLPFAPLFLRTHIHTHTYAQAYALEPLPLCHHPQWLPPKWSASSSNVIIALPHQKFYLINNNSHYTWVITKLPSAHQLCQDHFENTVSTFQNAIIMLILLKNIFCPLDFRSSTCLKNFS